MNSARKWGLPTLIVVSTLAVITTLQLVFLVAPVEKQMGIVQKIFYFHVPSAFSMYIGALACFVGSTMYLLRGSRQGDALARAGAEVAVIFGAIVLVTGPLWAAKAWGAYWTWEPRLTTSLLSVLVYLAYLVLRGFGGDSEAVKKFAAAMGFLGAVNLPVIHFSVRKWSGQHPQVVFKGGGGLHDPDMKIAFAVGMVSMALVAFVLLIVRYRLAMAEARVAQIELDAAWKYADDDEGEVGGWEPGTEEREHETA